MYNAGDFNTTETVHIPLNSFDSNDPTASVTMTNLAAGDIEIHKDGSTTQRASDSGVTVSIDFDTITGNHMIHIDLSDNTDAGFYSAGSRYLVRIEGVTVDGGTLNAWVGGFSIGCTLRPTTAGRTLDIQSTGEVDANLTMMGGVAQSATDLKDFADTGYDPSTHLISEVTAARMGALTDWINGGRLDLILDSILEDTGTTLQNELDGIQADTEDLQTQIGTDGAGLTNIPWNSSWDDEVQSECTDALNAYDPPTKAELDVVDGHVSDTFDDVGDVKAVVDNIIADTNELQTDWHDGGRLDLILDTAAAGGGGGGDATEANQTTIISHLEDIKGAGWTDETLESLQTAVEGIGGLTGSNAITLTIQAPTGTNIVGATVDVFDSGNTTFIGRLTTDSSGQAAFSLDDGTYTIRIIKAGYTFDNETLVVDGVEAETYIGTAYAPAAPAAASICRVYEYAYDPDGTPMSNVKAYAKINTLPYNANSVLYAGQNITAEYDPTTGQLYWDLVQASSVKFTIKDLGIDYIKTVPASDTARLTDI